MRESIPLPDDIDHGLAAHFTMVLRSGLIFLAALMRPRHGRPPLLALLSLGGASVEPLFDAAAALLDRMNDALEKLRSIRRKRQIAEASNWARHATAAALHGATKLRDSLTLKTASASKMHQGERTDMRAALQGSGEWGTLWQATSLDTSRDIMEALEALDAIDAVHPEMKLPPIDGQRVWRASRQIKVNTGLGADWARPWHIALISNEARAALASLMMAIERIRRWPRDLRWTLALALGKKSGGARLIGVSTSIYRIWSRIRYADCRAVLEARVQRPFFIAAPGRGAERAAVEMSLAAEVAAARDLESAASTVDLKQFYENVTVADFALEALRQGVPKVVVMLTAHLYTGPRVLRVKEAVAPPLYPRKSIVAGCTWATFLVRILMLRPLDKFMKDLIRHAKLWQAHVRTAIYIDDGILMTTGSRSAVEMVHTWATRMLIQFLVNVLRKPIAREKLACVASTAGLRDTLRRSLKGDGFKVELVGELLGFDIALGRPARKRRLELGRFAKAFKRKRKLRWLRKRRGDALYVAKSGVSPSVSYGGAVNGLRPSRMRDLRNIHGAVTRVRGGGSLTTRLALGGPRHEDADPTTQLLIPALLHIARLLWDAPQTRHGIILAWRRAHERMKDLSPKACWAHVVGPVSAAMAQLRGVGGAWEHPLRVTFLDHSVDMLTIPPLQLKEIMRSHIRRHLDRLLIERICIDRQWDLSSVAQTYTNGIEWSLIRRFLNNKELPANEKWAFELLACGAIWDDVRRWQAGFVGHGTCRACMWELGTLDHFMHDGCTAMASDRALRTAGGGPPHLVPSAARLPGLEPMALLGLPPKIVAWTPVPHQEPDGQFDDFTDGKIYGDGSGILQSHPEIRKATWAIVSTHATTDDIEDPSSIIKQSITAPVPGWFPTVPRGELWAAVMALQKGLIPMSYVGDCRMVIDGCSHGVALDLMSSNSKHADLWRRLAALLYDHGPGIQFIKTKAHRSRAQASADLTDDLDNWHGNRAADSVCKGLAKRMAQEDGKVEELLNFEALFTRTAQALSFGASWMLRNLPGSERHKMVKRAGRGGGQDAGQPGFVGDHLVKRRPEGGYICEVCRLCCWSESGKRWLRSKACRGAFAEQIHSSHVIRHSMGVSWCQRCGAYAVRMPRTLRERCPGAPRSEAQRNVRRRLFMGLPPTTSSLHVRLAARAREEQVGHDGGARIDDVADDHVPRGDGGERIGGEDDRTLRAVDAAEVADRALPPIGVPHVHRHPVADPSRYRVLEQRLRSRASYATAEAESLTTAATVVTAPAAAAPSAPPRAGDPPPDSHRVQPTRRLREKTSARAISADAARRELQRQWCWPAAGQPWASRLRASGPGRNTACSLCERQCATSCKGCSSAVCTACAMGRQHCHSVT